MMNYSQMTDVELLMEKSHMEQVGYAGEVQLLEINEELEKRWSARRQAKNQFNRTCINPRSSQDMFVLSDSQNQLYKDIKENFVDDFLNFSDSSVGWYAIEHFSQSVVNEINDDIEGVTVVSWSKYEMVIECEGLQFYIGLPNDDSHFEILAIYI